MSRRQVIKRDGSLSPLCFDKITARFDKIIAEYQKFPLNRKIDNWEKQYRHILDVDPTIVTGAVANGIVDKMHTWQIDELGAKISAEHAYIHPDYSMLGGLILSSNLRWRTPVKTFSEFINHAYHFVDPIKHTPRPLVNKNLYDFVMKNSNILNAMIKHYRDDRFDYLAMNTFINQNYLMRFGKITVETPQYMYLRVATAICLGDLKKIEQAYEYLSQGYYTHATPTLFNAGTPKPQSSSCYLLTVGDNIESFYRKGMEANAISARAGGIGIDLSSVRAAGSYIAGSGTESDGLVPLVVNLSTSSQLYKQGMRRPGAFAVYLEPWHPDLFAVFNLRDTVKKEKKMAVPEVVDQFWEACRVQNIGLIEELLNRPEIKSLVANGHDSHKDETTISLTKYKTTHIFLALWMPDEFLKRVAANDDWYFICPSQEPRLHETYGAEFEELYAKCIAEGRYRSKMKAIDVFARIVEMQSISGMPYILFKDNINRKRNDLDMVIKCSNLCAEIVEPTSEEETAVCNLASIILPAFLDPDTNEIDYEKLAEVSSFVTEMLDLLIDTNYYPELYPGMRTPSEHSNKLRRPIGIGVQGLHDLMIAKLLPFLSQEARIINSQVYEAIYYGAVLKSTQLAERLGSYPKFSESAFAKGILQFDHLDSSEGRFVPDLMWKNRWDELRPRVKKGMRNSQLTAQMPTASTSSMGMVSEGAEPYMSVYFVKSIQSGDFAVINRFLIKYLVDNKIDVGKTLRQIRADQGSVQSVAALPPAIREVFLTVWEMKMKGMIEMAADRGRFLDQTQSLNIFMPKNDINLTFTILDYGRRLGNKTGSYYIRTRPAREARDLQTDKKDEKEEPALICKREEGCIVCSS